MEFHFLKEDMLIRKVLKNSNGKVDFTSDSTKQELVKYIAMQYAKDGIRVNSIHPGTIATPLTVELQADETALQDRINRTPLGRLGTAEDVAYGIIYLASEESSYITGSELVIDGGRTAQ